MKIGDIYISKPDNDLLIVPGEKFEVIKISTYKYTLKHVNSDIRVYVKPENFNQSFELAVPEWTKWEKYGSIFGLGNGDTSFSLITETRNNGHKVQLRTSYHGKQIMAESSCSPEDEFDEKKGLKLAKARLRAKLYKVFADELAESL